MKPLAAGVAAPDFTLRGTPDQQVTLSSFRGKPVILVFYPADWSPVCSDQLALYQQLLPEFAKHDAVLLAISVDNFWCHVAFAEARKLAFPLLADFNPRGQVAASYGVFNEEAGQTGRALFVIDRDGTIAWSYLSPNSNNPGADGILDALEELSKSGGAA